MATVNEQWILGKIHVSSILRLMWTLDSRNILYVEIVSLDTYLLEKINFSNLERVIKTNTNSLSFRWLSVILYFSTHVPYTDVNAVFLLCLALRDIHNVPIHNERCRKFAVRIHGRIRSVKLQKRRLSIDPREYIYSFCGGLHPNVDASMSSTSKKRIQSVGIKNRE